MLTPKVNTTAVSATIIVWLITKPNHWSKNRAVTGHISIKMNKGPIAKRIFR